MRSSVTVSGLARYHLDIQSTYQSLWTNHVLSLALVEPTIRYATIALGSAAEASSIAISKGFDVAAESNASKILSLQYYNKSIHALQDLVARKAGNAVPVVLFCSLIFMGIDMIYATRKSAGRQLQYSLRVFYSWAHDIDSMKRYDCLSDFEQIIHNFFSFLGRHSNAHTYLGDRFSDYSEAQLKMHSNGNAFERFRIRLELLQDETVSFFLKHQECR